MSSETNQNQFEKEQLGGNGAQENGTPELSAGELQRLLAEEKAKSAELTENWQRSRADFMNLKRRTESERFTLNQEAREKVLVRLLPVVDDFERALKSMPESLKNESWINGINLIEKKLKTLLDQEGVSEVPAVNEEFNPRYHEAVSHTGEGQGEKDYVAEVYQKGYRLGDKVIRPAMVVVERR